MPTLLAISLAPDLVAHALQVHSVLEYHEHKKRHNQGSPPTPKKAERAYPTETHPPTIHPPYPLTMETGMEQGCSTPPWTPNVSKAREKAEATISSESDSDSYYSDYFDSANAPDPTPTNAHMGTPTTQSVHSIEVCYKHQWGTSMLNMKLMEK
jgi:hypothetical protein